MYVDLYTIQKEILAFLRDSKTIKISVLASERK